MSSKEISSTIFTSLSGVIGGSAAVISSHIEAISLHHIIEVTIYAIISAIIGYTVKIGIDSIRRWIKSKRKKAGSPDSPTSNPPITNKP